MHTDLRSALRHLRRHPLRTTVVACTLGLGIGAALAAFAVVDAVLVRVLPFEDQRQLVRIMQKIPVRGLPELSFSDVGYRRLATDARTLSAVAAYDTRDVNLIGRGVPQRLTTARVTASLFDVLRVRPAIGRSFTAEEDLPNAPRAVVLADWLWRAHFAADPGVIGTAVNLDGEPFTIIGVLPPDAVFPARRIAAWEPLRMDPVGVNPYGRSWDVVARMKPGVTIEQVRADVIEPIRAVGREYPGPHAGSALDMAGYEARVRWLGDEVVGDVRPVVALLLGGVTLLLILTCANVANLQLASAMARREELAVRTALGASRRRLVREALVEGVLLAMAGGAIGLAVGGMGTQLLAVLVPDGMSAGASLADTRGVFVTVAIVLLVGAAVGALPAAVTTDHSPAGALRARSGLVSRRVRRLLAATQVALAVMLLHGSGLLLASARSVEAVQLGFRPESTMTLRVNLAAEKIRDRTTRETLLRRLLTELQQVPGVRVAALANALPLERGRRDLAMALEGRPFKADGTDPLADYRVVSAGYFDAMGIRLLRGRTFTDDEANERYTPLVISAGLAREIWGDDTDPIGHRLRFGPAAPWMPIIGVVADAANRSVTEAPRPELYAPALGTYASNLALRSEITVLVRAGGDPASMIVPMRRIVATVDPELPVDHVASMVDVVRGSRARMTSATQLMAAYAVAALLLAMAGTYTVLSYLVAQRGRELAIRLALGETARGVVALVARETSLLVGAGVVIGLLSAVGLARLLTGLLYGVGTVEPWVVLAVLALASVAGIGAAAMPARRAARVDPCVTLREG